MSRKILIVGGVAGGASVAARLRRHSESDTIIMFERGPHVSFSNCALPYHLSGIIEKADDLLLMHPNTFAKQYRIEARINNEVVSIDSKNKIITVKDTITGQTYHESYDKLVLSPGANPKQLKVENVNLIPTFSIRNVVDIDKLNQYIKSTKCKKITVIGGGYIGIEAVENLAKAGYEVTLVEAGKQILVTLDEDMIQILHKELLDRGVTLKLQRKVVGYQKDAVLLDNGEKIPTDTVISAIGVAPDIDFLKSSGLEITEKGTIKVDQNYVTSQPDIYAVGDAITVHSALGLGQIHLPLAGAALKQARSVADHINGLSIDNRGYIGSSAIQVFRYNAASTGLTETQIKNNNLPLSYEVVKLIPNDKVGLMPDAHSAHFKLIYELPTGRVLGAQSIGYGNIDKRIDVIATLIKFGGTVLDLKDLELCYAPPFSTAKDVVNFAGYIASNLLRGDYKQVHTQSVRDLVKKNAVIIDVREEHEYQRGHIKGALNIPLSQFRDRLDELPKEKPLYIHCRSGQRSYNACLALQRYGFSEVYNISAGFMGLCFYEYFTDTVSGREPIVTQYNFD